MGVLNQILKKFKSNGIVLLDQAIVSGGNFLLGIALARTLGLEQYGVYALFWMYLLFGLSISQALVTKPMLSLGPQKEKEEQRVYLINIHSIQYLVAIFFAIITLSSLCIASFMGIQSFSINLYFILPCLMMCYLLYDFYRRYFFIINQLEKPLLLDAILQGLSIFSILILAYNGVLSLEYALLVLLISYLLCCTIGFFLIRKISFNTKQLKHYLFEHVRYGKWLIGTSLLQWLSGNLFIIAGAAILGAVAVGAIRMVQNVIGLTHILFLAMENIVPVRAAQHYKEGGATQLLWYLKKITINSGIIVGAVLVGLALFAPYILKLLYGAEQMEYSYILIGYCLIYLLVYIGHPSRFALRTIELTKPIFVAYVISAAFSLVAAYPMLEWWGMYGLLGGLFVTQLITQLVYLIYLYKIDFFSLKKEYVK